MEPGTRARLASVAAGAGALAAFGAVPVHAPAPNLHPRVSATASTAGRTAASLSAGARASVATSRHHVLMSRSAPSQRQCWRNFYARCYGPRQLGTAYDVGPLWNGSATGSRVTGKGETIVIVDSFGSPTIRADVKRFDQSYGLPAAHLLIDRPEGPNPRYVPGRQDRVDWATETTLDVDYAHAMAPGATIRLLETPVDETEGTHGLPQMMQAEQWAIHRGFADVISQSFGATEQTFPGFSAIRNLRGAFQLAKQRDVTVLAASGDSGATDLTRSMNSTYRHRVQSWPSADPLVTSVGGLHLDLSGSGARRAADRVWHDDYGAGGGGRSKFFARPSWQDSVASTVGERRGVPDVSMTADVDGGALIWTSFRGQPAGWQLVGGTSLATPVFAGIVALADQAAGHRLGLINPAIYRIGAGGAKARRHAGLIDVTKGSNSFAGVKGYAARSGYDLASGWGTVDAAKFVPALVAAAR
jgi:subtilase family serine protease